MLDLTRSVERVKKLSVVPVSDGVVRFRASLEDRSADSAGGELIHSLAIEGTISLPDLTIRSIEPCTLHQPYAECLASLQPVREMVGMTIGRGFRSRVQALMGSTRGCTHYLSLALDLAASHTLTTFLRMRSQAKIAERHAQDGQWMRVGLQVEPGLENACIALSSNSEILLRAKKPIA